MKKLYNFICTVATIVIILGAISMFRKMQMFKEIKEMILELEEIDNYYQKQELGFIDEDDIDEIIYRRYGDIVIKEDNISKIVSYEEKTYYFDKQFMFFMEDNTESILKHNITINDFPVDLMQTSNFALACHVELKTVQFNDEKCYSLGYEIDDIKYTKYIRKEDGVCMGVSYEEDGKIFYDYYTTEIDTQIEENFNYETMFEGYDELKGMDTDRPYVIRSDGRKEYIIFSK